MNSASVLRTLAASIVALAPVLALGDGFKTPGVTAADVEARQSTPDAFLVVDVRPNVEYKSGHIAGAINIPYTQVDQHLDELRKAKGVVLYCTQGIRTQKAEKTLLDHQVPNVYHLEGGLGAWLQARYTMHTGWGP